MTTLKDRIRDILLSEKEALKTNETTLEDLLELIMKEISDFTKRVFEIE